MSKQACNRQASQHPNQWTNSPVIKRVNATIILDTRHNYTDRRANKRIAADRYKLNRGRCIDNILYTKCMHHISQHRVCKRCSIFPYKDDHSIDPLNQLFDKTFVQVQVQTQVQVKSTTNINISCSLASSTIRPPNASASNTLIKIRTTLWLKF